MLYFSLSFLFAVGMYGDSKELFFVYIPHQFLLALIEQYAILIV